MTPMEEAAMSTLLERPAPAPMSTPTRTPPRPVTAPAPIERIDLTGNPVAAAHERRRSRPDRDIETGRLGRILVLGVVVPAVLFLVSNPLGWLLLFFTILAVGALTGIGSIL
jgi:hypothetical protein